MLIYTGPVPPVAPHPPIRKETVMRSLRSIYAAFAFLLIAGAAAFALTIPATYAPRMFQTEQTHYLRFTVNWNDCVLASNTCSVKRGAVPYNAWIIRINQQIITNFNSGSTDTVAITTAPGAATASTSGVLMDPVSVHSGAGGATSQTVKSISAGINATGNGDTPTGSNGGFDIYSQFIQGSTAPSAGQAVYVIEYIAPNDGSCIFVPLGSTATAC